MSAVSFKARVNLSLAHFLACILFLRFTSSVPPPDCIEVCMAAEPFLSTYLCWQALVAVLGLDSHDRPYGEHSTVNHLATPARLILLSWREQELTIVNCETIEHTEVPFSSLQLYHVYCELHIICCTYYPHTVHVVIIASRVSWIVRKEIHCAVWRTTISHGIIRPELRCLLLKYSFPFMFFELL